MSHPWIADNMVHPSKIGYSASAKQPVGYFQLFDSFAVACYRRPAWVYRFTMRLAFGWTWRDANPSTSQGTEHG